MVTPSSQQQPVLIYLPPAWLTSYFALMASFEAGDPYRLERLAEELASREKQASLAPSDDNTALSPTLPDYSPLSHDNPLLTGPIFNVEEFLLSRATSSLPELRTELRDYLSTLKEELVQLINNDYEAFISLSTDLRSEGSRLKRMRGPLGELRGRVLVCPVDTGILGSGLSVVKESRKELRTIQDAIQEKLDKRATLREEKVFAIRCGFSSAYSLSRHSFTSFSRYQSL